jgi:hypothetical protein
MGCVKRLIAVSLIVILVSGCGKSSIPQLSVHQISELESPPSFESLYSMTPLDYKSKADEDIRNSFFKSVTIGLAGLAVCIFVSRIGSLIDGSISLFNLVSDICWSTASTLWLASILYVYLFPNDTSYKNSSWCERIKLIGFAMRTEMMDFILTRDFEALADIADLANLFAH